MDISQLPLNLRPSTFDSAANSDHNVITSKQDNDCSKQGTSDNRENNTDKINVTHSKGCSNTKDNQTSADTSNESAVSENDNKRIDDGQLNPVQRMTETLSRNIDTEGRSDENVAVAANEMNADMRVGVHERPQVFDINSEHADDTLSGPAHKRARLNSGSTLKDFIQPYSKQSGLFDGKFNVNKDNHLFCSLLFNVFAYIIIFEYMHL